MSTRDTYLITHVIVSREAQENDFLDAEHIGELRIRHQVDVLPPSFSTLTNAGLFNVKGDSLHPNRMFAEAGRGWSPEGMQLPAQYEWQWFPNIEHIIKPRHANVHPVDGVLNPSNETLQWTLDLVGTAYIVVRPDGSRVLLRTSQVQVHTRNES